MFRSGRWLPLVLGLAVFGAVGCSDDDPTDPIDEVPPAPTNVSVTESEGALVVSWNASANADSYIVQRRVVQAGSSFANLAQDVTGTSHADDSAEEGVTYDYRVIAVGVGGQSNPSDPATGMIGLRVADLQGLIEDERVLSADTVYTIRGLLIVDDGGVLRIPAGTLLKGSSAVQPTSAVIVRQGGRIFSEGTADDPVVFTSDKADGQRAKGDWGGVVINGRSQCNFPAGECVGEGNSGPYGGNVLDDDSGRIVYTRIEFAGFEVSLGNELNALTLNGVGSGTEIHHVQVHYGSDDGIELFGGTVDLKYVLATGIDDDSFDYSTGWAGRGQFWIAQQEPNGADNGFEVDGNENDSNATPYTNPLLYNVSLIGKGADGAGGTAGESTCGMLHRLGTAGRLHNVIVTGFGTCGVDIDNAETVARMNADLFWIQNSIVFSNASDFATDDDGIDEEAIVMQADWNNRSVDPGLTAPFNRTEPDFRPAAGSAATEGAATPPNDDFFEAADFLGGVGPGATEWYRGWTTFAAN
jgi:hypothetical protein